MLVAGGAPDVEVCAGGFAAVPAGGLSQEVCPRDVSRGASPGCADERGLVQLSELAATQEVLGEGAGAGVERLVGSHAS